MLRCAAVTLVLAVGPMVQAQSTAAGTSTGLGSGDVLYETLKAMQDEIDTLRRNNESMRGEIDELRARTEDNWLTEARAREIRGLVEDVLADADTRANLLNDGIMAGWSEHFFLADAFGRFLLQVDGMTQIRGVFNYRPQVDRGRHGFEVTRTRLTFRGHMFNDDWQYLVRLEATPHPPGGQSPQVVAMLDSWVRFNLSTDWSIRAGQFKLPFNREELVAASQQLAVERSMVNEATSLGRSPGVELHYHDNANSLSLMLSSGMNNRNTLLRTIMPRGSQTAIGGDNGNVEYAFTTRYERLIAGSWNQFADFTSPIDEDYGMLFGIAGHIQQNESDTTLIGTSNEPRSFSATTDLSMEWGGANAFVAFTYHYVDSPGTGIWNVFAVVAQAGVYVAPKWELFARAEWSRIENDGEFNVPSLGVGTIGVNYYIEGHDVKWTTDFGFSFTEVAPPPVNVFDSPLTGWRPANEWGEVVLRSQIQLLF